jgi:hypothetical protein
MIIVSTLIAATKGVNLWGMQPPQTKSNKAKKGLMKFHISWFIFWQRIFKREKEKS